MFHKNFQNNRRTKSLQHFSGIAFICILHLIFNSPHPCLIKMHLVVAHSADKVHTKCQLHLGLGPTLKHVLGVSVKSNNMIPNGSPYGNPSSASPHRNQRSVWVLITRCSWQRFAVSPEDMSTRQMFVILRSFKADLLGNLLCKWQCYTFAFFQVNFCILCLWGCPQVVLQE